MIRNFEKDFVSFFDKRSGIAERQRERWNQVEPRCAERWHGCSNAEMMSNSTLPLGHSDHHSIEWWSFFFDIKLIQCYNIRMSDDFFEVFTVNL